jgi:hypothetical protein
VEPAEVARWIADLLEAAGVPYAVGGAIAYGYWGAARATHDVDVNLFIPASDLPRALDALAPAGLAIDRAAALATAEQRGDARGRIGDVPIDLFVDSIPLHAEAARRAVVASLSGRPMRILSAEDLAIFKLLFFRGKDIVDVERLVALQGARLDRAYIRRWLVDCVGPDDARVHKWDELSAALTPGSDPEIPE